MTCYIKNPITCFTKLWLWQVTDALSPGGSSSPPVDAHDHDHSAASASSATMNKCHSVTGWMVGQDDVLVIVTFALVLISSWLLRGYLVTTSYNAVVPKVWKNSGPMSLGAGLALVGLTVLLIR